MAEMLAQPIPFSLILETVAAVIIASLLGVWLVNRRKVD